MDDLEIVYTLRQRINRLEYKLKSLTCENVQNNSDINRRTVARINKIEARLIILKGIHNDRIYQVYSSLNKRSTITSINTYIQMKITEIDIEDTITTLKMTPIWFKLDDKKNAFKDIIYPTDGTDRNLINTVARYRTIIGKSKNFRDQPLEVNQNSIETIIIALDIFVRQYGGELSFTNEKISFNNSIEHTAEGIANLGCIHLLVANFIPTAIFSIKLNLNYDRDLGQSISSMKKFIFNFNKELAYLLKCQNNFIRIFSIEKIHNKRGMIKIYFGLTTYDQNQTILLARRLQTLIRRSDFRNNEVLRFIESNYYQYKLIPILSYLQLSPHDFDINSPYYLPNGWFRHSLNLLNKYSDDNIWFDQSNIDGEWPVAYHGTFSQVINKINQQERLSNSVKKDDVTPALYVTTNYNDSADKFTEPFIVSSGDQNKTFRIVFQCRVKPNSFTIHTDIVEKGEAWRIVDPQAIRSYGLLLKNETSLS